MFHLAGFTANNGIAAIDADTPVMTPDPSITVSNNHLIMTVPFQVVGAYAIGASLIRARIQTPKLRALANIYIQPFERGAVVPQRPNYADFKPSPLMLNPIDETQVLLSNNAAAAEQEWTFLWCHDGKFNIPVGQIFTVRATTTFTSGANAWSGGNIIVIDSTLPAGRYSVVGLRVVGANILAARLIFPNQVWRPGVIGAPAVGTYMGDYMHRGYLGEFGQFESIAQPQIEVAGSAGVVNPEVFMDLIRVR